VRDPGQPHLRFNLGQRQPVAPQVGSEDLTVTDDDVRLAIQQPFGATGEEGQPAEHRGPEGEGRDRQQRGCQAEVVVRNPLLDEVAHHHQDDQLERGQLCKLALAKQADEEIQPEENDRGAQHDIHQGRTSISTGRLTSACSPS
jgi:hypothetical protein